MLKSDKRDALSLGNQLYNQLEKGIQVDNPLQAVRRLAPPTEAAAQLRGMVQHHAELVVESTPRKNKFTSICDELFPEFTRLLLNPNLPTALALRSRFPTPALLAQASFGELREARGKTCGVSDVKLRALQRLATQSIGIEDPTRVNALVVLCHIPETIEPEGLSAGTAQGQKMGEEKKRPEKEAHTSRPIGLERE